MSEITHLQGQPTLIHATRYLPQIRATGEAVGALGLLRGGAEGRVYACANEKTIRKAIKQGANLIEFTGQAAELFTPHPAPIWSLWGMWKRYLGKEWRTTRAGDVLIESGYEAGNRFVVTKATIKPHTGLRLAWSQFRLIGRIVVIEPVALGAELLIFLPYAIRQYQTKAEFFLGLVTFFGPIWLPMWIWLSIGAEK